MSQPLTKARRSGKKLRHAAKLERRRLDGARWTIHPPSLGAKAMLDETKKEGLEASQEAISEPINSTEENVIETAGEIIEGELAEEHLEGAEEEHEEVTTEGNTATPLPVMADPASTTEPVQQAAADETPTEIKEPTEQNG